MQERTEKRIRAELRSFIAQAKKYRPSADLTTLRFENPYKAGIRTLENELLRIEWTEAHK